MRIWILIFSAALFVGGTCLGVALQPRLAPPAPVVAKPGLEAPWGGPRHYPPFSVTRFATDLALSDEQDRELDAILGDSQEEMQALGRAMHAAQEKSRQRITEILTPEQKKRLDELMAAERTKRSEADLGRVMEIYRKVLSLTDAQALAMRAAYKDAREHRHEGKGGPDHQSARKSTRDEQVRAIEKVLTPEQFQQYLVISELER